MTRKEIVKKLGEHLGVTPKYLSVPSFNYQITTADETYTIDRHGVIATNDGQVVSMEEILNAPPPSTVVAEEEITGEMPMEAEPEAEAIADNGETQAFDSIEVKFPLEGHSVLSLRNIINMLYSKRNLLMLAFKTEDPFMDDSFAEDLSKEKINTVEDFKAAFEKLGADTLSRLSL